MQSVTNPRDVFDPAVGACKDRTADLSCILPGQERGMVGDMKDGRMPCLGGLGVLGGLGFP